MTYSTASKAIFLSLVILLQSCTIFHDPQLISGDEAGDVVSEQMSQGQEISSQLLNRVIKQRPALAQHKEFLLSKDKILKKLLTHYSNHGVLLRAIEETAVPSAKNDEEILALAFILFPIQKYQLIASLENSILFSLENIENAALIAKVDPSEIFQATASSALLDIRKVTPLINSTSITLYDYSMDSTNEVWYKEESEDNWLQALPLQWDPIDQALSGSIVWLSASTQYDVKIQVSSNGIEKKQQFQFTTRDNEPPIDPEKIYYLSDFYTGGALDLTLENIQGTPDGWAKIIGDGVVIEADEADRMAVNLGNLSYIMLENISTKGGKRFGIYSEKAHHIWIKGCNISEFGRVASDFRNGKGYENPEDKNPINYDSGIYLKRTGTVVVEDCEIHSPNNHANHWGYGHPNGSSAMLISANDDNPEYSGQYIIRNNRFYGTDNRRFNDVIEGYGNRRRTGGFVRDSAIYNNYLAYANDDLIELDGGQSNILFYNNELTQGYCGVSVAPNMQGPSFVFNNHIHNLGDETGKEWAAIKMGGLFSAPAGQTFVFQNLIDVKSNGITYAKVDGDIAFWTHSQNNVILTNQYIVNNRGYGIFDKTQYSENRYLNDYIFNRKTNVPLYFANESQVELSIYDVNLDTVDGITSNSISLLINDAHLLPNFSFPSSRQPLISASASLALIKVADTFTSFSSQNVSNAYETFDDNSIRLSKNTWIAVDLPDGYNIDSDTQIQFTLNSEQRSEIIGIGFENNNGLSSDRVIKLAGSQRYGKPINNNEHSNGLYTFYPRDYIDGEINRIVFILDNDKGSNLSKFAEFKDVKFIQPKAATQPNKNDIIIGTTE
jgi:hypothetical protein